MDVTIAICTWNRSHLLRETLEAMTRMRAAGIEWELLVVDNNCTDDTSQVIASFAHRLPIRGLCETTPGQSAARNTAIAAARGRHIIWTDDDVLVDDAWLVEYARAFATWPDAAVFGGPIEPWFEGEPPRWLRDVFPEVSYAYAACDFGNQELELRDPDRLPYGANMAFLLSAQREVPYDTRVGLRPSSEVRGDETTAIVAVLQRGHSGRWVPAARVRHFIPKSRQRLAYLKAYYRGRGEYTAVMEPLAQTPLLFSRPRWAWRTFAQEGVSYGLARATSTRPGRWIDAFKRFNTSVGFLRVRRSQSRV